MSFYSFMQENSFLERMLTPSGYIIQCKWIKEDALIEYIAQLVEY